MAKKQKRKPKLTLNTAFIGMRTDPKFKKRVVQSKKNYSRKKWDDTIS